MAKLIEGKLAGSEMGHDEEGRFVRHATTFRDWVSHDGSTPYPVEAGRYRLYVALACPWCHRTLLVRKLLGLEEAIPVSLVQPFMGESGWTFEEGAEPLFGARYMHELYTRAQPDFTGRITVPVLWDTQRNTIVNNESSDLIRMFDGPFAALGNGRAPLFPEAQRDAVDAMIEANYEPLNNGVYRAGFARKQAAYEEAVNDVFARLDALEEILGQQRYLCGDTLTAADLCLFPTLYRFDAVYHFHFKCTRRPLREYPSLWAYTRDLYQTPGVRETVDMASTREHYFTSHESINPTRIIPVMPDLDFDAPHGRA